MLLGLRGLLGTGAAWADTLISNVGTLCRQPARPSRPAANVLVLVVMLLGAVVGNPTTAQAQTEVPANWSLIPTGLGPGDSFRLMFIPSNGKNRDQQQHRCL